MLSRFLNATSLWLLERGSRLGLLDLLAGSTTVAGTIFTQITLRAFTFAGLVLVIIWSLSPIGGQASLRVIRLANSTESSLVDVQYMGSNSSYDSWIMASPGPVLALANGLFNSALLAPKRVKDSPRDPWNNVKIPMIEFLLPSNNSINLNDTWQEVPPENVTYSALVGIATSELPINATSNFTMESSYITLQCPDFRNSTQPDTDSPALKIVDNSTKPSTWSDGKQNWFRTGGGLGPDLWSNTTGCRGDPYDAQYTPRLISYNAWDSYNHTSALCILRTSYVETEIHCTSQDCAAKRMRRSTTWRHPSPAWTFLDGGGGCIYWSYILGEFASSVVVRSSGTMSPLQGYLIDPYMPASAQVYEQSLTNVDPTAYSTRFAQQLNTFWLRSAGPYAIAYGFAGEPLASTALVTDESNGVNHAAVKVKTTATAVTSYEVLRCNVAWLLTLLIASLFLLCASIATIILRVKRNTPELLLNWTTVVRHSHYIDASSDVGSFVDDAERSRLLANIKIRFGDVAPEKGVGHLAIGARDRSSRISEKSGRSRDYE